jgi:hypothetical protein
MRERQGVLEPEGRAKKKKKREKAHRGNIMQMPLPSALEKA